MHSVITDCEMTTPSNWALAAWKIRTFSTKMDRITEMRICINLISRSFSLILAQKIQFLNRSPGPSLTSSKLMYPPFTVRGLRFFFGAALFEEEEEEGPEGEATV